MIPNHIFAIDPVDGVSVRMFNPRQDDWETHFQLDHGDASIIGLTPVGRAVITLLRFNSFSQLNARNGWIRLGLFP